METKKLVTRFHEVRTRISDPQIMLGKLLAESVTRPYTEDFVDSDTGEVKQVERREVIVPKGRYLTKDDIARISFYQQEGSVEDVLVTNQDRKAEYCNSYGHYFEVVASEGKTKKRLLVGSINIPLALQTAIDYCEQTFERDFTISSVKTADNYRVLTFTPKDNEEEPTTYYTITVTYWDGHDDCDVIFLTLAKDADTAIAIVRTVISSDEDMRTQFGDNFLVTVSKTSPITDVVPLDFCKEYVQKYRVNEYIMDGVRIGQMPATV